eukprot:CAMPEP_0171076758 /NCGR_PEP_ID=MMETSP0766_2-20121228/13618_1 /TAXON_ID=439317 /ORGANISM="Gambierdiscus australes, Strain CAWD 149" /LENGTH=261 /DNA_ID=CAMNT_0011533759 /DNA_START=149 /DNA_END=934 /DNA_ORIENTATION=-
MPVGHPDYAKRKGRIYLSLSDHDGPTPKVGDKVSFLVYTDGSGLGAMNSKPADSGGVQKPIGKPQTLGPPGSKPTATGEKRESVGDDTIYTGKIQTWNGSHGWILPMDTITHPLYKGKIYLKSSDVEASEPLNAGTVVSFSLYTDSQGLGAERVTVAEPDAAPPGEDTKEEPQSTVLKAKPKGGFPQSPFPPASPPAAESDSVVLKAKPKMSAGGTAESSVLKAKPKMAASAGKPTSVQLPAHLNEIQAQRLVAWMWDRGG